MTTYSVRCRHQACRVRKVVTTHPDDMQAVQCTACGHTKGWRVEQRAYNQRNLCTCSGPEVGQRNGEYYPHKTTHPLCDRHPHAMVNQARARGQDPFDAVPLEHLGQPCTSDTAPF